jgi:hypothetical protein
VILPGTHNIIAQQRIQVVREVLDWLDRYLAHPSYLTCGGCSIDAGEVAAPMAIGVLTKC